MLEDGSHREWTFAGRWRRARARGRARPRPVAWIRASALFAATWTAACDGWWRQAGSPPPPSMPATVSEVRPGPLDAPRLGPFLRSRDRDPVSWRPWSPDLFARDPPRPGSAEEAGGADDAKPVMVVLGYADCEDCRLRLDAWAREPGLASLVDRLVVPVLVDRDERPDVDASLMRAVHLLSGTAGWPAVVFLDPGSHPFAAWSWGAAGGEARPLRRVLEEVERRSLGGTAQMIEKGMRTAERLDEKAALDTSGDVPAAGAVLDAARAEASASFDPRHASFGEPPLFPRAPLLELLLHLEASRGDVEAGAMARATLSRLASGDMRDPSDGGFFRFAREPGWKVVSREKPMADNAALSVVMAEVASRPGGEALREASASLLGFVEGAVSERLAAAEREASGTDTNADPRVFADALGLGVSALARASRSADVAEVRGRLLATALEGAGFLAGRLTSAGFVRHCSLEHGLACADGYLDDQVFAALAFLDVAEALAQAGQAGASTRWLVAAREVADAMPARFGHEGTGGFFFSGADAEPSLRRHEPVLDGARPCGNSAAATLYLRLSARTGEPRYRELADGVFAAYAEILALHPLALPSMVVALDLREADRRAVEDRGPRAGEAEPSAMPASVHSKGALARP